MGVLEGLIVGSWPGPGYPLGNKFLIRFGDILTSGGLKVVDVTWPWFAITRKIDILQIHWPDMVFWRGAGAITTILRTFGVVASLLILKLKGVELVWCVHDLAPHDASRLRLQLWRWYATIIAHLVDAYLTLSPSTITVASEHFVGLKGKAATFFWHPPYEVPKSKFFESAWREKHGIQLSANVLALVGQVRAYKGVEELVSSFCNTKDPNLRLVVAGMPFGQHLRDLLDRAANFDHRIILDLRWLSDQELCEIITAANLIVLPFKQTLHSGSIIYGLSCGRAVLTPATPFANDLKKEIGDRWIRTYETPLSAAILSQQAAPPHGMPDLEFLSVRESGEKLRAFYHGLAVLKH